MKRVTLKDLAKSLNTTIATVSRALHDHPEISDNMKNRVKEAAALYNYKPNTTALSLKFKKSYRFGVIFPRLTHYYLAQILSGMLSQATKAGYKMIIAESNYNPEKEMELIQEFYELDVDAILILPSRKLGSQKAKLEKLIRTDIPFVIIDRLIHFKKLKTPLISSNDDIGTKEGIVHLIDQGYKKIAHLRGLSSSTIATVRVDAYLDTLKAHHMEFHKNWLLTCKKFNQNEGEKLAKQLMEMDNRPDAIFCVSDNVALGVIRGLKKMGIRVPEDVGVLGFSNSDLAQVSSPSLSSIHQPGRKIGIRSIKMVLSNIDDKIDISEEHLIMKTRLVVRKSTMKKG
ncbi:MULTISPECIES: LacI family DNA-binding transcriptional regulator [unclassified Lentimicrobium]|uniref:LacI family DNA-binding transcriptional regulator n=1 Tax=unclassified Lentimicrobium TaxID=2677434 RepID=UPI001553D80B|nr:MULTISPECIES: LacI family DNA-binding transcriptional regulator [unclassified Lentimicrobium]NPD46257.1 LacI family DNA-binding transcriptional regulator [Lentimicrobium sp. S6]NPD83975.1 LacI family DNA-binding transcriptional regulator [Lentimicrobium sp. L6]